MSSASVYFVSGVVAAQNFVGIAAYLHELENSDREFTRFYMYDDSDGDWGQEEFEHQVVATEYLSSGQDSAWYLLSKRGIVIKMTAAYTKEIVIETADTGPGLYGYVNAMREIAGELYVCGFRRQVYRLVGDEFIHLHSEILASYEERGFSFESIDGTSRENLYAVGRQGEVFGYDGLSWRAFDVPTNRTLTSVRCDGDSTVYACGYNGVVIRSTGGMWEDVSDPDFREHIWGMEIFEGIPYFSFLGGVVRLNGSTMERVLNKSGYKLHARNGVMWSFGNDDLYFYNGRDWHEVICPDNA
jgi:hypothetical protein